MLAPWIQDMCFGISVNWKMPDRAYNLFFLLALWVLTVCAPAFSVAPRIQIVFAVLSKRKNYVCTVKIICCVHCVHSECTQWTVAVQHNMWYVSSLKAENETIYVYVCVMCTVIWVIISYTLCCIMNKGTVSQEKCSN